MAPPSVDPPSPAPGRSGSSRGWLRIARFPVELLRRAQEAGYGGGKTALYELIRRLRPVPAGPVVRFEGVPGKFSQHNFGQVTVRYTSGGLERIRFFASRLKWSRLADVALVLIIYGCALVHEEGITVIFVEQNVELALRLAHRGYVLESGRTILGGMSAELLRSLEVKRIFLGDEAV